MWDVCKRCKTGIERHGSRIIIIIIIISARIATKLHTRTKNLPGKVLKPISIGSTYWKWWKQPFVTLQLA